MTPHDRGILLVATGHPRHLRGARRTAARVREVMPHLPICLASEDGRTPEPFHHGLRLEGVADPGRAKIEAIAKAPYARVIYMDNDIHLLAPIDPLFDVLDRFDVAAAHAPRTVTPQEDLPVSFPEFNAGIVAWRASAEVHRFLGAWRDAYDVLLPALDRPRDQPSFRRALYLSGLRVATLPPEWNLRFMLHGAAEAPVRVLHGYPVGYTYEEVEDMLRRAQRSGTAMAYTGGRFWVGPEGIAAVDLGGPRRRRARRRALRRTLRRVRDVALGRRDECGAT